jgi:succinyl-CoA synthetase beta subunit
LLAKKMQLEREFYFAIMMDRASQGPMIIACAEGGTSIEDLELVHSAVTTEETPLSLQKLWSGDGQSEMVGNRAEKNLSWSVR